MLITLRIIIFTAIFAVGCQLYELLLQYYDVTAPYIFGVCAAVLVTALYHLMEQGEGDDRDIR